MLRRWVFGSFQKVGVFVGAEGKYTKKYSSYFGLGYAGFLIC